MKVEVHDETVDDRPLLNADGCAAALASDAAAIARATVAVAGV
jgi:hypothetical protein